ncbi:hypothetical protein BKA70DRAFT_1575473 [Coprinopsis sp. MPI-PUGE-AT-0042]|nr:hypothetical protein BKA70DRAFT_1575473 [Coprinopsis sp. MPI-PUGE-AT-0042]
MAENQGFLIDGKESKEYMDIIAASQFGTAILGSALLALQIFLVLYCLANFLRLPKEKRKGRRRFIVISVFILLTSSIDAIFDIWATFRILYGGGNGDKSYLEAWVDDLAVGAHRRLNLVGDLMLTTTIVASNVLMLWRCLVLWSHRQWVVIFPSLTCAGSVVCYAIHLVAQKGNNITERGTEKTLIASASLNLAFNLLITLLILLQITLTLRRTAKAFPDRKTPRMYTQVTSIIVESATPLSIFGICLVIARGIQLYHVPDNLVQRARLVGLIQMFQWLYHSFCALSPQIIIFRVTSGQAWINALQSGDGDDQISRAIQFARPRIEVDGSSSTLSV